MAIYKIKIYPTAQQDFRDIIDYLNTLSPDTALRYYDLPKRLPAWRNLPNAVRILVIWR